MQTPFLRNDDGNEKSSYSDAISRREFVGITTAAGGALFAGGYAGAQSRTDSTLPQGAATSGRGGLLYPQQNQTRNVLDISGLWQFQLDPKEEGEAQGWFRSLPAPRQIAVQLE
jgi:beta-glucuronidase